MNKKTKNKIKKLTKLESECLSLVISNGVFQECFEGDHKRLKAFERAEKKLRQLEPKRQWSCNKKLPFFLENLFQNIHSYYTYTMKVGNCYETKRKTIRRNTKNLTRK